MLGIAPAQVLAHQLITATPKAGEVLSDLLRAAVGRAQFEQYGMPLPADRRRGLPTKELLDAHLENRPALCVVAEGGRLAVRQGQPRGGFALEGLARWIAQLLAINGGQVDRLQRL